jgi:hypothetical protein
MMPRSVKIACFVVAAGLAVPTAALASKGSPPPRLVATVEHVIGQKRFPRAGSFVTVTFTVGEPGKPPGSGIPRGSVFEVLVTRTTGSPTSMTMATARGRHGRYRATIRWPGGHIGGVEIGGFLNAQPSPANGDFWLPVTATGWGY